MIANMHYSNLINFFSAERNTFPLSDGIRKMNMLGSKTLGFKCIRILMCNVGKS